VAGFDETTLRAGPAGQKKYVHGAFTEQYSAFFLGQRTLESHQPPRHHKPAANPNHRTSPSAHRVNVYVIGPPKSKAGKRVVAIPDIIIPAIRWHLSCFTGESKTALVFTSPTGKPLRHSAFRERVWLKALAAGLDNIHFLDLRHTGNNLAATAARRSGNSWTGCATAPPVPR
jgi:hypothetical protein